MRPNAAAWRGTWSGADATPFAVAHHRRTATWFTSWARAWSTRAVRSRPVAARCGLRERPHSGEFWFPIPAPPSSRPRVSRLATPLTRPWAPRAQTRFCPRWAKARKRVFLGTSRGPHGCATPMPIRCSPRSHCTTPTLAPGSRARSALRAAAELCGGGEPIERVLPPLPHTASASPRAGTFGRVLECWDRQENERVAVKIIRTDDKNKYYQAALIEARAAPHARRLSAHPGASRR